MARVFWCFSIKVLCFVLLYCLLGFLAHDDNSGCGGGGDDSDDYNDAEVEENNDDDNDNDDNTITVSRISPHLTSSHMFPIAKCEDNPLCYIILCMLLYSLTL